jgi:hypothetical protein
MHTTIIIIMDCRVQRPTECILLVFYTCIEFRVFTHNIIL